MFVSPQTRRLLAERLARLEGKDASTVLATVLETVDAQLAVESGCEVLFSLARSLTLMRRLALQLDKTPFNVSITLFQHQPYSLASCFRVFVHSGKITAISQLMHVLVFPQLCVDSNRALFEHRVCEYVASLLPRLGQDSAVLDVALTKAGPGVVLEVHPFDTATDALLFSWVLDDVRLHHGPVELRACTRTPRIVPFGSEVRRDRITLTMYRCGLLPSCVQSLVHSVVPSVRVLYEGDEDEPDEVYATFPRQSFSAYMATGAGEIARDLIAEAELDHVTEESLDAVPAMLAAVVLAEGYGVKRSGAGVVCVHVSLIMRAGTWSRPSCGCGVRICGATPRRCP